MRGWPTRPRRVAAPRTATRPLPRMGRRWRGLSLSDAAPAAPSNLPQVPNDLVRHPTDEDDDAADLSGSRAAGVAGDNQRLSTASAYAAFGGTRGWRHAARASSRGRRRNRPFGKRLGNRYSLGDRGIGQLRSRGWWHADHPGRGRRTDSPRALGNQRPTRRYLDGRPHDEHVSAAPLRACASCVDLYAERCAPQSGCGLRGRAAAHLHL
jgi:hypothetical protein